MLFVEFLLSVVVLVLLLVVLVVRVAG